jgi:hypothetical protein
MIQTIIVLFAIAAALIYVIWKIIKRIKPKKGGSPCDGCDGCDLKSEWMKNQTTCSHNTTPK